MRSFSEHKACIRCMQTLVKIKSFLGIFDGIPSCRSSRYTRIHVSLEVIYIYYLLAFRCAT